MNKTRKQLLEKLVVSMGDLHRAFATSRDIFLANFNLSRQQIELLLTIKHQPLPIGEIAKKFIITSSAVSQMVDQLENKGLVDREQSKQDRRVFRIKLAPEAKKVFNQVRDKFAMHLNSKFKNISDKELSALLEVLTKTADGLKKAL